MRRRDTRKNWSVKFTVKSPVSDEFVDQDLGEARQIDGLVRRHEVVSGAPAAHARDGR
jgi:hypothetical protein